MYELVIANKNYSSWSMRPWVLMRQLGIPFTERKLSFHEDLPAGVFLRYTPSGRVPCLIDGDLKVWDSLAIMEYLAERHVGVWPAQPALRAWARCAAAEMHSGFGALRNECSMSVGIRARLNEVSQGVLADLARLQALWAEGLKLGGGPYLAGPRFTAVDAFFAPVASRVRTYGLPVNEVSQRYLNMLLDTPAVKEWIDAGVKETWRDEPHETEIQRMGTIVEDHRA